MDRVAASEAAGRWFESSRARQYLRSALVPVQLPVLQQPELLRDRRRLLAKLLRGHADRLDHVVLLAVFLVDHLEDVDLSGAHGAHDGTPTRFNLGQSTATFQNGLPRRPPA